MRAARAAFALWLATAGMAFSSSVCAAQAPVPDSPAIEAQAHAMIAKLTLEQKIELLGGVDNMFTHAHAGHRLAALQNVRCLSRRAHLGTDNRLCRRRCAGRHMGHAISPASSAKASAATLAPADVNFLLGPGVNIARSPVSGRNFEYLSEDPFLNATLVVPYIQGVQSQGVVATVKHYALNDQEFNRHNVSSDVDERTMREIYLPAFEAAVTKGHVDAVMDSYNLVNGVHATQNDFLNLKVLKGEWGFQGVLMSDWDATYDGVAAANNGLDLEMPSPKFMNAKDLVARRAKRPGERIHHRRQGSAHPPHRAALRIHRSPAVRSCRFNLFDCRSAGRLEGALESITLLKNEGKSAAARSRQGENHRRHRPRCLSGRHRRRRFLRGHGFRAGQHPHRHRQPRRPRRARPLHARPAGDERSLLAHALGRRACKQATYPSKDFSGTPELPRQPIIANYKEEWWGPEDKTPRSIRYTAAFKAAKAGKYLVLAAASGSDRLQDQRRWQADHRAKAGRRPASRIRHDRSWRRPDGHRSSPIISLASAAIVSASAL